jgi:hypothetical protein
MTQKTTHRYAKGDCVEWRWGQHLAYGQVEEIYYEKVSRTIKGSVITRNGSPDEPAYLIRQEDGDEVLKLQRELSQT